MTAVELALSTLAEVTATAVIRAAKGLASSLLV